MTELNWEILTFAYATYLVAAVIMATLCGRATGRLDDYVEVTKWDRVRLDLTSVAFAVFWPATLVVAPLVLRRMLRKHGEGAS